MVEGIKLQLESSVGEEVEIASDAGLRPGGDQQAVSHSEGLMSDAVTSMVSADQIEPCKVWTGFIRPDGYGAVCHERNLSRRVVLAHRLYWEIARGPVPKGLHLHHVCRNRACCNPAHMVLLTPAQHVALHEKNPTTINANKTTCVRGHSLKDAYKHNKGRGRQCRICHLEDSRMRRAARKAQA